MMALPNTGIPILILSPLLLYIVIVEGNPIPKGVHQNATSGSPWVKRATNPRDTGCWKRPWICNNGQYPPRTRMRCCRNRCVDVSSDVNNCGLCGIRCPFTWQCCRGFCINTNVNPFHCGSCDHRCPIFSLCFYGMCGYAQPLPPYPFPFPPLPPFPHPPKPFPPHPYPPKPFPPHPYPPKPFPPHRPHPPKPGQPPPSS